MNEPTIKVKLKQLKPNLIDVGDKLNLPSLTGCKKTLEFFS